MSRTVTVVAQAEIHLTAVLHDDGTVTLTHARATAKANDVSYVRRHPREGIEVVDADELTDPETELVRACVMAGDWPTPLTLFA